MWKGIVFPTFVMAIVWFLVSSSTTYYIYWLNKSYDRVFEVNVTSIHTAGLIRETAWSTLSTVLAFDADLTLEPRLSLSRISDAVTALELDSLVIRRGVLTERESLLADRLDAQIQGYRRSLESFVGSKNDLDPAERKARIRAVSVSADQLCETAQEFCTINQQLIDEAARQRNRAKGSVLTLRMGILFLGPGFGIAYGWWMAGRLQRTVARITVSLRDLTNGERTLGDVSIDQKQDWDALHTQVELVVTRMREVNDELQRARHEVLRSERLAAVGELAAGVAHELRNPLTSVKLLLQHAVQLGTVEHLTGTKLQLILDEIARMESTIQGLLDFSRPQLLHRSPHDVRETLRRAINLVIGRAQQQKVDVAPQISETPLIVEADAGQLLQVFVNLLINGVESMPEGGRLLVIARRQNTEPCVLIEVHDTGPGISPAIMKRLFEPFATTKERGTGLGLAVSRRIIEQHRGTIHAENDPAGGALFRVILPAI